MPAGVSDYANGTVAGTRRTVVPLANVDALELLVDGTVGYFAVADARCASS